MPLTLAPETEARLRSFAADRGQDPEETLTALVDNALAAAEAEFSEAVAGIRAGMEDFAAGRWISLEELEARLDERRAQLMQERHPDNG